MSDTCACACSRRRARRRRQRELEVGDFLRAARRFIAAAGRRAGDGDEIDLGDLATLSTSVDDALVQAIAAHRVRGQSWAWIASGLGVSPQAAQQRFGARVATYLQAVA